MDPCSSQQQGGGHACYTLIIKKIEDLNALVGTGCEPVPDEKCPIHDRLDVVNVRKGLYVCILAVLLFSPSAAGGQPTGNARGPNRLEKTAADVVAAAIRYRATLERVLAAYERAAAKRAELAELRLDLFERGVLSRREFEESQLAQAAAQRNVEDTRRAMAEADHILSEAYIAESLARLTPLGRGGYEETGGLVRFNGPAAWALAADTPRLQQFFLSRYGRPLPISSFGQTPLHDRMGLDHRNALDVAVHPDSPEGRGFMEYLRSAGIPFIAAWGAIPGSASGAHIHVGQPSPRVSAGR